MFKNIMFGVLIFTLLGFGHGRVYTPHTDSQICTMFKYTDKSADYRILCLGGE